MLLIYMMYRGVAHGQAEICSEGCRLLEGQEGLVTQTMPAALQHVSLPDRLSLAAMHSTAHTACAQGYKATFDQAEQAALRAAIAAEQGPPVLDDPTGQEPGSLCRCCCCCCCCCSQAASIGCKLVASAH